MLELLTVKVPNRLLYSLAYQQQHSLVWNVSWLLTFILLMWRIGRAPNSIPIYSYIQQHATSHSLFMSANCYTCFGWYFHPSSGAHTTVSTASGICHTVTAIYRYQLEQVWVCCGWRTPGIFPGRSRRLVRRADKLTTLMCRLSWNLGSWNFWNPQGLSRYLMGLLYLQ
jgi:hypothetical protein